MSSIYAGFRRASPKLASSSTTGLYRGIGGCSRSESVHTDNEGVVGEKMTLGHSHLPSSDRHCEYFDGNCEA